MSTIATTPNPETMPLGDLKQAAGLNSGLLSGPPAAAAPAPAPTPVPAPIVPEKYTLAQDDNGVTITLSPEFGGEVFKGKDINEAVAKLAGSKDDANAYIKQLKTQPAPTPAATPPAAPPEDPAELATRDWMMEQVAKGLGMSGKDELLGRMGLINQTTESMATNLAVADFHKMCPGYVDTPENSAVIGSYFPDNFGRFPSAQELKQAYALAVVDGKITPQSAAAATPSPRPPVMPTASGSIPTADANAWTMDLNQLKKAAGLG